MPSELQILNNVHQLHHPGPFKDTGRPSSNGSAGLQLAVFRQWLKGIEISAQWESCVRPL